MQKYADYIEEIEIDSLEGKKHTRWTLRPTSEYPQWY